MLYKTVGVASGTWDAATAFSLQLLPVEMYNAYLHLNPFLSPLLWWEGKNIQALQAGRFGEVYEDFNKFIQR